MKVTGHATIKGRGTVTIVDSLPAEVQAGSLVTVRDTPERVWKVRAIETYAMPRSHTNGKLAGLLLSGDRDPPSVGEVLTILLGSVPRFGDDVPGIVRDLVLPVDGPNGDCNSLGVCSACGGAGKKFYAFRWLPCPTCDGTGKLK